MQFDQTGARVVMRSDDLVVGKGQEYPTQSMNNKYIAFVQKDIKGKNGSSICKKKS